MKFYFLLLSSLFTVNAHALRFDHACDPGKSIIVGAAGDVLLHSPLQKQGYKYGFNSLWSSIESFMRGPDIMYANLEGPAAEGVSSSGRSVKDPGLVFDDKVHTGYPMFNYHPVIISDLKKSGVDILSTANNHAMDRGVLGVQRTIEALEDSNMPYIGTRADNSSTEGFYRITTQGGFRLGWIACSWGTNGLPDKSDLVLDCFDTDRVSQYITLLKSKVDAVIVTPHWGEEYQNKPNSQQIKFGRRWLDQGASAIIGAHPHVPQTWEKYKTVDGREGLILYSLGNFVSAQSSTAKQSSLLLFLGLSKAGGKTWVNGVRYLPLFMKRGPYQIVASNQASGKDVAASLAHVKKMFGEDRMVQPGEDVVTNPECD